MLFIVSFSKLFYTVKFRFLSMRRLCLVFTCFLLLVSSVFAYDLEFYHSDHLGSPVVVTDESGAVQWSSDYDIFGASVNEEGDGDLKYNQKEKDDTGLLYYGARYYNAELGRFITADTVKGTMTDLQSQNLYVYVQNNPMKYVDPTGNQKVLGILSSTIVHEYLDDKIRSTSIVRAKYNGGDAEEIYQQLLTDEDFVRTEMGRLRSHYESFFGGKMYQWNSEKQLSGGTFREEINIEDITFKLVSNIDEFVSLLNGGIGDYDEVIIHGHGSPYSIEFGGERLTTKILSKLIKKGQIENNFEELSSCTLISCSVFGETKKNFFNKRSENIGTMLTNLLGVPTLGSKINIETSSNILETVMIGDWAIYEPKE